MKAGYALDMKPTGFGLVPLAYHASAVFADPKTDVLYLLLDADDEPTDPSLPVPANPPAITETEIFAFNSDSTPMTYQWKSKLYVLPHPKAFLLVQVKGETLTNTVFRAWKRVQSGGVWSDVLLREVVVTSDEPFKLPMDDDYREFWWEVISTDTIQGVQVVEDVMELA